MAGEGGGLGRSRDKDFPFLLVALLLNVHFLPLSNSVDFQEMG